MPNSQRYLVLFIKLTTRNIIRNSLLYRTAIKYNQFLTRKTVKTSTLLPRIVNIHYRTLQPFPSNVHYRTLQSFPSNVHYRTLQSFPSNVHYRNLRPFHQMYIIGLYSPFHQIHIIGLYSPFHQMYIIGYKILTVFLPFIFPSFEKCINPLKMENIKIFKLTVVHHILNK